MVDWNLVKEACLTLLVFAYHFVEGIVKALLPSKLYAKDVRGQTVLVTGSGSGFGKLLALNFARLGCRLVLWDINSVGNEETGAEIKQDGGEAHVYTVDLSCRDEIYSAAEKVKTDVGDVDILINNAGIVSGKKFLQCSDTMIQKTMEVNIMAHFWTVKSFLPSMIERNHGHLVTIASAAGIQGVNGLADYCASKFAAVGFDESMRFELEMLGKHGVNTTVVCPFYCNTGMFEGVKTRFPLLLPIMDPKEAADRIVEAILCNRHVLYLPRIMYFILGAKAWISTKNLYLLCHFFGINNSMDEFRGRLQKKME